MRKLSTLSLCLLSFPIFANSIPQNNHNIIGINATELSKRVCYYQNHAYSEGAIIQVSDYFISCGAANDFETNGKLKWLLLNDSQPKRKNAKKSSNVSTNTYSVN